MFYCSMCGECCRHINLIPELAEFDDGTGVCVHLCGDLCSIYENRPDICNVDVMYDKVFNTKYTREEFYRINQAVCKEIIKLKNSQRSRNSQG